VEVRHVEGNFLAAVVVDFQGFRVTNSPIRFGVDTRAFEASASFLTTYLTCSFTDLVKIHGYHCITVCDQ
jgi:hypothetical protein